MLNLSNAAKIVGERPRVSRHKTYTVRGYTAAFAAIVALNFFQPAHAQSATGASNTRCDQTGQSMSCVTTTVFALPTVANLQSGTSLSAFTLSGSASNGAPTCSSLVASPQSISAITSTTINLTASCQAGATLTWSGVLTQSGSTAQDLLTLVANASKTYTLTACSSTQPTLCNVYTVTVTTSAVQTPSLQGCVINPGSAQLTAGATPNLTVSCAQGTPTSYSWSVNNTTVSTSSSYSIPSSSTAAGANLAVAVALNNGVSSASANATYSVAAPTAGACTTSGDVARTINYSDNYIALNDITMGGRGAVYTLGINVGAGDSSVGKSYLPVWVGTNSPISQNGQRTVSVSLCPNDFDPSSAQIVATGSIDFAVNLTTEKRRVGAGTALVEPGRTYYINVRNDTCPKNGTCSLDGQYRNWNQ